MKCQTKQEVFNRVITHLVSQGQQSVNVDGLCLYHSPSGTSCAVGCLISEEDYSPSMEGADVGYIVRKYENLQWMQQFGELLDDLQDLHDVDGNWDNQGLSSNGLEHIQLIADMRGLTNPLS